VDPELARWAAARAPDLLARAEAEAVAEIKRALTEAVLARRDEPPSPPRRPPTASRPEPSAPRAAPSAPSPSGEGLWAYCVTSRESELPEGHPGVHPAGAARRLEHGRLAALVSSVPLAEFGEESLRENLNDLGWLESVARAHEAALEAALSTSTIVPLRLCTIYQDERGVQRMLETEGSSFEAALDLLAGRQEWGVKLLVDRAELERVVRAGNAEVAELERELSSSSGGGAYMMGRRVERQVREAADRALGELAEDVHARLQDWADGAVLNAPQNRDLSGHQGEMILNGAYLVEVEKVDGFRDLVAELQERHRGWGAQLELAGPWPPYNFVPGGTPAADPLR
jgi:hypothetical protein